MWVVRMRVVLRFTGSVSFYSKCVAGLVLPLGSKPIYLKSAAEHDRRTLPGTNQELASR